MTTADKTLRIDRTMLNPKKPNGRSKTLAMAIAAGVLAAVLAFIAVKPHAAPPAQAQVAAPLTPVVVAAQDIPARTLITDDMLKVSDMQTAPNDSVQRPVDLVGKITVAPVSKGLPLTNAEVTERGVEMGLSYAVPAGYRAVTVALDPISSVAGFVKPGDHVDVIATFDTGNNQSVTRTILQNVMLLATGSQVLPSHASGGIMGSDQNNPAAPDGNTPKPQEIPNATLAVQVIEAQKLVLAAAKGKLQLSLRPATEVTSSDIPLLHSSAITGIPTTTAAPAPHAAPPPPAPALPAPPAHIATLPIPSTITVIRGSDAKTVTVNP